MLEAVIGLELHIEMNTKSKMFSCAPVSYGKVANTSCDLLDFAFPGTLPTVNKQAVINAVRLCNALNMEIDDILVFDRKNYFYSDLPKGYQITQQFRPIGRNGYLTLKLKDYDKKIEINRLHLEEDTCKQIHDGESTYIDYNRAGIPLIELVTYPTMTSGLEAKKFVESIRSMIVYLNISEGKMEEGNLRVDVNVSMKEKESDFLGNKVEIKNINTLSNIESAIDYEIDRQSKIILSGHKVKQETRRYDESKKATISLRDKFNDVDYRYFTDSNIPPIKLSEDFIKSAIESSPELASERYERYRFLGLSDYDSSLLVSDKVISDYFDDGLKSGCSPKLLANWVNGEVKSILNKNSVINVDAIELGKLIKLIEEKRISNSQAKEAFFKAIKANKSPLEIVSECGYSLTSNDEEILINIKKIIDSNPALVVDYKAGRDKVVGYLVGQVMKATKGKADPITVNKLSKEELKRR